MLPKPALLSSIEVPEPALSLSSAGLALLRVLAVSMYFIGTIPDNGTTQPALYRPPHCTIVHSKGSRAGNLTRLILTLAITCDDHNTYIHTQSLMSRINGMAPHHTHKRRNICIHSITQQAIGKKDLST